MKPASVRVTRRQALQSTVVAGVLGVLPGRRSFAGDEPAKPEVGFFIVGDTHYRAANTTPEKMLADSALTCGALVETLNRLPGTEIPAEAGGGTVAVPRGVIHVGDVIDTGDKQGANSLKMQQTEWSAFRNDYGLKGGDGRLKYPVYELCGNHDAPQGKGLVVDEIIKRNRDRPAVTNLSKNGLHYSWDWESVHFINLGLIVGNDTSVPRKRRFAAADSLDFLIADLRDKVGTSGRPVVISHHVDIKRYVGVCDAAAPASAKEWDSCDVAAYYKAISGYRIAGIFFGHTHARNAYQWNGATTGKTGFHVFNNDNSSHFAGDAQAMMYVTVSDKELIVREYQTKDRWKTGSFTPQQWVAPLPAKS